MITQPNYRKTRIKMPSALWVWSCPQGSYEHTHFAAWRDALRQIYEHEAMIAAMPPGGDVLNLFARGVNLDRR